jgi:hypothetical protein
MPVEGKSVHGPLHGTIVTPPLAPNDDDPLLLLKLASSPPPPMNDPLLWTPVAQLAMAPATRTTETLVGDRKNEELGRRCTMS